MRVNNKINNGFIQNMVYMLPFLFVFSMFLLHLAMPDKTYSKEEHRYLAQWPAFRVERVIDGSYKTKVEAYFSDQFPFRNFWVQVQKDCNQIFLKER